MTLQEILDNKDLNTMLYKYIHKAYKQYNMRYYMEQEDFEQEMLLFFTKYLHKYDKNKGSISTFLYQGIYLHTCRQFQKINGRAKIKRTDIELISLNTELTDEIGKVYQLGERINDKKVNVERDALDKAISEEILELFSDNKKKQDIVELLLKGESKSNVSKILNIPYGTVLRYTGSRSDKPNTIKSRLNNYYKEESV